MERKYYVVYQRNSRKYNFDNYMYHVTLSLCLPDKSFYKKINERTFTFYVKTKRIYSNISVSSIEEGQYDQICNSLLKDIHVCL